MRSMARWGAASAAVIFCLAAAGGALAQQNESKIGAWRYIETRDGAGGGSGFAALASSAGNDKAALGFMCSSPSPVSIMALVRPGEALGVPRNGALKKKLTYQVDGGAPITHDWFYPDETKGETDITKTIGVDSFDVLNAVRKGQKTVRVRAAKADGKTVELSFDIAGADAALDRLVADCKSVEYR